MEEFPDEPKNKAELLERIRADRQALDDLLASFSADEMTQPLLDDGWSLKDTMAHIVFWEQRMLAILGNAAKGEKTPSLVQPEEGDTAIDRVNAEVYAAHQHRPLSEVHADYERSFADVLATLEMLPEETLFDPGGYSSVIGDNVLYLIGGNTFGHYQEHIGFIGAKKH
jgi:hypothetical protein